MKIIIIIYIFDVVHASTWTIILELGFFCAGTCVSHSANVKVAGQPTQKK